MAEMKTVVKTYMFSTKTIKVLKENRFDYKNGTSITETTLVKKIFNNRYALLECGHTREQHSGENFEDSKRLACHYCDQIARHKAKAKDNQNPIEKVWLEESIQNSLNNLQVAKLHMLQQG